MKRVALCVAAALIATVASGCDAAATPSAGTLNPGATSQAAGSSSAAATGSGAPGATIGATGSTSGAAGTGAAGSGNGASAGTTAGARASSCHPQFTAWQNGPAKSLGEDVALVVSQVQAAANAQNGPTLRGTLQQAGQLESKLHAYPMPACADPAGYWGRVLSFLKAAGDSASTAKDLDALLAAATSVEKIPGLEAQLAAEVASTAAA